MMIPSGSELEIRPEKTQPEELFGGQLKKLECYWALYDYRVSVIRADEVKIEWI